MNNDGEKYLVLAGTYREAEWFCRENGISNHLMIYVASKEILRGYRDMNLFVYGTAAYREDFDEIIEISKTLNMTIQATDAELF